MLAFSTCWSFHRAKSGEEIVRSILDLGIDTIELGHGLKAPVVQEILAAQKSLKFTVSSVHNFCPLPPEVMIDHPDCYEFTSHRPADRDRAVRLTLQTIDMAERLGARVVVVHSGKIRTLRLTDRLRRLAAAGKLHSREYVHAKIAAVQRREAVGEVYIQRALECFLTIADYASRKGIQIGIENREDYEAMPSEREFDNFLRRLDAPNAAYWHDFGHAQIKEQLSLIDHFQWLETAGTKAIGAHVHDVKWPFQDHRPPFTGEVPFARLVPLLTRDCIFVFELHPHTSRDAIRTALAKWRELFGS